MLEDYRWFKYYLLVLEYKKVHGNCNMKGNYVTKDGIELGKWYLRQKRRCIKGDLSPDKASFIRGLDRNLDTRSSKWHHMYSNLENYYKINGNSNISTHDNTNGMGSWVNNQRKAYSKLSQEQIKLLNNIDFEWSKKDTMLLNAIITDENYDKYNEVMLKRMNYILKDLAYELDGEITDISKQKSIEEKIIKRMWR